MKNARKLTSILLLIAMLFMIAAPAMAADETGSITIENTVKGTSYSIYRIFNLESYDTDSNAYSYKVNDGWQDFFTTGEGSAYVAIENDYVKWNGENTADRVAEFAQKALSYAKANSTKIAAVGTKSATSDNETIKFTGLTLGYYLVDSSLGALCALTTTDPTATVTEKNSNPSLTKEVQENSLAGEDGTEGWGDKNDANVGETVKFRATITVQGSAKDYVMHDKMDDGLTFKEVTGVTLNGTPVTQEGNYTVRKEAAHTDGTDTFDVEFTEKFCESLKSGDVIVVSYEATLNENAVVKEPENNNAHLEYKDNNGETHETEDDNTQTYTWGIPVLKYANGNPETPLAGAIFSLYTDEACNDADIVRFNKKADNQYQVNKDGEVTQITTGDMGRFNLDGLDEGTYYLKEIDAPTGYNKLDTTVTVVIDHDGNINATDELKSGQTEIQVENKSGVELPSTGGIGTTIFYVVGAALVVGAGVLLVTKKRMTGQR